MAATRPLEPTGVVPDSPPPLMRDLPAPKKTEGKAPASTALSIEQTDWREPPPAPQAAPAEITPLAPPEPQTRAAPESPLPITALAPDIAPDASPAIPPPRPPEKPEAATPAVRAPLPDLAEVLKGIRLPEKKEFRATGDAPPSPAPPPTVVGENPSFAGAVPPPEPQPEPETISKTMAKDAVSQGAASVVTPLRTLKQDLQDVVRVRKISLVRAAALEEEKRARKEETPVTIAAKKRRVGTIVTIILLVLVGSLAIAGVLYVEMQKRTPARAPQNTSIIFAEQAVPYIMRSSTPSEFKRALADARLASGLTLGAITRIVPVREETDPGTGGATQREITFEEFARALGGRLPEELIRATGERFFFGIHTVDENAPVIIVPVLSYERAFAAMLSWEDDMNADLSPLFTPVPTQKIGPDGLPTKRVFEDTLLRNYDARALKDDAGEIQLFYAFPTRNILIIGESPYTFTEALSRLRAERKL